MKYDDVTRSDQLKPPAVAIVRQNGLYHFSEQLVPKYTTSPWDGTGAVEESRVGLHRRP